MHARTSLLCLAWAVALTACPDDKQDYDDTRERGDLGRGRFVYDCVNATDSACQDGAPELPQAQAVGGRFDLRFAVDTGPQPTVIAPSGDFVRRDDGAFQVRSPGDFALLAVNGNREVIDIKHLRAARIAEIRVQQGHQLPAASLTLEAGASDELLAVPFDQHGVLLGGALDYAWHSSDEGLLQLESLPDLNRVRVRAGARSGTAKLQVEVADASYEVSVRVTGGAAEELDAGEPDGSEPDAELEDAGTEGASADADAEGGAP